MPEFDGQLQRSASNATLVSLDFSDGSQIKGIGIFESISGSTPPTRDGLPTANRSDGYIAIVKDVDKVYVFHGDPAADWTTSANWTELGGTGLANELNDLTAAVTWTNVPDTNITETSVTQHEAALSISQGQVLNLTGVGGTLDNLQSQITGNGSDITANATAISTNTTSVSNNAGSISGNTTAISNNANDIATNTADIATNTADIATNTASISGNTTSIGTLNTTVSGNTADISTNTTSIGTLNTTVSGHTTDIGTLNTTVSGHTTDIGNNASSISGHTTDIGTLNTTVSGHTTDIGNNASSISSNTSAISSNTSAIASNVTSISGNTTNIGTNAASISSNTTNIATNTTNITTNTSSIASNASGIATNASGIATNIASIASIDEFPDDLQSFNEVTGATLGAASDGEYYFLVDKQVIGDVEYKKLDSNELLQIFTQQVADYLIDNGFLSSDEISSEGILADINGDGIVGTNDLLLLLAYYGNSIQEMRSDFTYSSAPSVALQTPTYTQNDWVTIPLAGTTTRVIPAGAATSTAWNIDKDLPGDYIELEDYIEFNAQSVTTVFTSLYGGWRQVSGSKSFEFKDCEISMVFSAVDVVNLRIKIEFYEGTTLQSTEHFFIPDFHAQLVGSGSITKSLNQDISTFVTNKWPSQNSDIDIIRVKLQVQSEQGNLSSIEVDDGGKFIISVGQE